LIGSDEDQASASGVPQLPYTGRLSDEDELVALVGSSSALFKVLCDAISAQQEQPLHASLDNRVDKPVGLQQALDAHRDAAHRDYRTGFAPSDRALPCQSGAALEGHA
jgi:hypothetical protein